MSSSGSIVQKGKQFLWTYQSDKLFLYGYSDSMEEAQKALQRAGSSDAVSVDELFEMYMKRKTDLKRLAVSKYQQLYHSFIMPYIGSMNVQSVTPGHLQVVLESLADSDISPKTLDCVVFMLTAIFHMAYKYHMLEVNPMEEVDLPKSRTAKTHRSSFSDEELDKLLRRIEGSDFELIFKLASWTGMRNGEILALQREDIDFDRKIICVRHNLAYVDHKVYMENPKTETSHRMIPISEEHLDEMRNWIESKEYKNRAAKACEINKDFANLVFLSRTGKPVKGAALSNCMRHVVEKMKKDGELDSRSVYTFHSLRHTFATRCLLKGMTPKVLSTLLGHSSTDITLRVYAHVNAEDERNEMERLGLL